MFHSHRPVIWNCFWDIKLQIYPCYNFDLLLCCNQHTRKSEIELAAHPGRVRHMPGQHWSSHWSVIFSQTDCPCDPVFLTFSLKQNLLQQFWLLTEPWVLIRILVALQRGGFYGQRWWLWPCICLHYDIRYNFAKFVWWLMKYPNTVNETKTLTLQICFPQVWPFKVGIYQAQTSLLWSVVDLLYNNDVRKLWIFCGQIHNKSK